MKLVYQCILLLSATVIPATGVFLKHLVFHILNMLKSEHLAGVKSPGLEYKKSTSNSAFP